MSIRDYKITDEQFNEKGMTSLPDTLKGTPYENKRSLEKFTREVVAPQFNAIVDNFADMEESANSWSAEEAQRVQQENARQSAEQGRVSAEGQRETNETARLLAEENRISAEKDRVTAETTRVNAENKRDSAEKSRVSAENARNVWQTYDAAKSYVPGNKVSFGGSSYVCTAATIGHELTDTAYWLLIAQKGMDGAGADDLRRINDALDAIDPTKITTKVEPADGDGVMIADSADGGKAKRLLWSNVKAALDKLFVPLARKINGKTLSADVTLTGENIAVSTTDSTPISGAVKYRVNPNLLDNWYFGNLVNQMRGYYLPQGAIIYSDSSLSESSKIGAAAYACTVVESTNTYVKVKDTKSPAQYYYAAVSAAVPGYCTVGYTVDRWWFGFDSGSSSLQLTNDGVIYNAGSIGGYENFSQPYPKESCIVGQLYTISFLVDNFQNVNQVFNNKTGSKFDITENLISYTFSYNSTPDANPDVGIQFKKGTSTLIRAAKLELGSTQTLAHKEGDKWILNEIPDYGEQLRRCQRYARAYKCLLGQTFLPLGAYRSDRKAVSFTLPTSSFRAVPTVSTLNDIFQLFDGANVYGITSLAVTDYSDGLVTIYAYTSQPFEDGKVLWLFSNKGTLLLSAGL